MFALQAVLFLLGDFGIMKRAAALSGDALTYRVDVEDRNVVGNRSGEVGAEQKERWQHHGDDLSAWRKRSTVRRHRRDGKAAVQPGASGYVAEISGLICAP
jgi:hypothetical protein